MLHFTLHLGQPNVQSLHILSSSDNTLGNSSLNSICDIIVDTSNTNNESIKNASDNSLEVTREPVPDDEVDDEFEISKTFLKNFFIIVGYDLFY